MDQSRKKEDTNMRYSQKIDLHTHTIASDGLITPSELIDYAIQKGLSAVAITDHDTIDGLEEAQIHARDKDIEFVPGVEITVDDKKRGIYNVHVLGLMIDNKNPDLNKLIEKSKKARIDQKEKMIAKLNELGYKISLADIKKSAKGEITRRHIALELLKSYADKFQSKDDIFNKLLGYGKKGYIYRDIMISLKEAVDAIKSAGGIPFLAHPLLYDKYDTLKLISVVKEEGIDGIETFYPYNKHNKFRKLTQEKSDFMIKRLRERVHKLNLIETAGSDFHGIYEDQPDLGELKISYDLFNIMKKTVKK